MGRLNSKAGDDPEEELGIRLARLSGCAGILKVGAATKTERDVLHQKAEKGIKAVRAALQGGVVPGGGAAYLHCIEAVQDLETENLEEEMGIQAVVEALKSPFLTLLKNGSIDTPGVVMEDLQARDIGCVFDVLQKRIVPAKEEGLLDATKVLQSSLETAASGANLALSTAVIVLKRKPQFSYEP
jgi:chaperonin GroEL